MSHELKNPLTSLKSAVETMTNYPDSPRKSELLEIINHDVSRMDRLITDISRSSRVDAEISRSTWDSVDVHQLISGLIEARQPRDPSSKDAVTFEVVAGASLKADVLGVGDRLAQVFLNLFDNAETFSPKGGKIQAVLTNNSRMLQIEVRDQGPGISADRLVRVFERFYTDRPEDDGFGNHSGLGLSIVRQIVEGHNGRIWADNCDDADEEAGFDGAKFTVLLPLRQ